MGIVVSARGCFSFRGMNEFMLTPIFSLCSLYCSALSLPDIPRSPSLRRNSTTPPRHRRRRRRQQKKTLLRSKRCHKTVWSKEGK